jgi:ribonucleoside-diphosphate reductase subunit M2
LKKSHFFHRTPYLSFSKELISHDKGLHSNFVCLLYSKLINHLPKARVVDIISSAVNIKMKFLVNTFPIALIGVISTMMCNYIKFCANRLLAGLGCRRHYQIGTFE